MPRAIGFTVKSGWAAAVIVERTKESVRVLESLHVDLCDPATPESKQPYHDGFATMRKPGRVLTNLLASVHRCGERSVSDALGLAQTRGAELVGAGVVVGSLIDPATIGNEHIRIHAMEGRLFREIVTNTAAKRGVPCAVWRERDLMASAIENLKQSKAALRERLAAAGNRGRRSDHGGRRSAANFGPPSPIPSPTPWRAEQKSATLAAWLVLCGVT